MIRQCVFVNDKDIDHEFQCLGLPPPSLQDRQTIQRGFTFKITGFVPEVVEIIQHCGRKLDGGVFLVTDFDIKSPQVIFTLDKADLKKFPQCLSGENSGVAGRFLREFKKVMKQLQKNRWYYQANGKTLEIGRPMVMGILNVTPDSFSDGGKYFSADVAYAHAVEMVEAGANIIDIGGESTRPGAEMVPLEEEWRRIEPVLRKLVSFNDCFISVDTYKSEVARRALESGAHIINDISGLTFDPLMVETVARYRVPVVIMHIKGTPRNMQKNPVYQDLMGEIFCFLAQQCRFAEQHGVTQIIVDPGIGFGKRVDDNFELIRRLHEFRSLGYPVLIGPSRKSFIGHTLNLPPEARLPGTLAAVLMAVCNGANIVRVHDVKETRQVLDILQAIREKKEMGT